jgi:hypothetical protein
VFETVPKVAPAGSQKEAAVDQCAGGALNATASVIRPGPSLSPFFGTLIPGFQLHIVRLRPHLPADEFKRRHSGDALSSVESRSRVNAWRKVRGAAGRKCGHRR